MRDPAGQQVVRKLATADGMLNDGENVADVCRELKVCEQTYYGGVTGSAG